MIRTDEQIKKDVIDQLASDYRVSAADVDVKVSDGKVTLTGTVPTYTARTAANTDAWATTGVKGVTNLLTVRFPTTFTVPTDTEIEGHIKDRLAGNPDVYSVDIDVSVENGVATLEGTVDAYWKKWRAEDLASDVRGVVNVQNHLAVVPSETYIDKDIAQEIEDALERNVYVDAEKVTVKVENGDVTLTGTVPTYYAKGQAYLAAVNTLGVTGVDNNTVVV